ncbi:MAG: Asp23/Gls24 family envelope stress response protein [Clostridia bacterium]|nr:Asp23/Gls24 family envelope stress response protein [Clostridia bacterium]
MNNDYNNVEITENDGGRILFSADVISTIAGLAAGEVDGVTAMSGNVVEGFTELFGKKNLTKGIKAEINDNSVNIAISVIVEYGYRINEVCANVQTNVKNSVETMTGLNVRAVNIYVQSISFPKNEQQAELPAE